MSLSLKSLAATGAGRVLLTIERLLRPGTRATPDQTTSVLILEYMLPLGSCVHMTPLYEALRRARPDLRIIVATRGLGLQVLRASPFIDHLLETPDPLKDVNATVYSLVAQLRARGLNPGCCLTGAPDQRTRIALVALRACNGWRGGYTVQPSLYQRPLRINPEDSQIANNLRLAELFGYGGGFLEPRIFYNESEADTARSLLEPLRTVDHPLLCVVTQNSGGQQTGWHDQRWIEVLRHAHQRLGYAIVFLGTSADVAAIESLRQAAGTGHSIAGQTTIGQLAAVLALADLVVSLDTGTMHVGRAVGVPMVVLGPSWQKPIEWLPLGQPRVRILRGKDRVGIPPGYRLDEISADMVVAATDELSQLYPANRTARDARLAFGLASCDHLR